MYTHTKNSNGIVIYFNAVEIGYIKKTRFGYTVNNVEYMTLWYAYKVVLNHFKSF